MGGLVEMMVEVSDLPRIHGKAMGKAYGYGLSQRVNTVYVQHTAQSLGSTEDGPRPVGCER